MATSDPRAPIVHTDAAAAERLYLLLALFDTRDGSPVADLVRAAREGYERSSPEMNERSAWDEFDALWARRPVPPFSPTPGGS